jgi:hypothetical protein
VLFGGGGAGSGAGVTSVVGALSVVVCSVDVPGGESANATGVRPAKATPRTSARAMTCVAPVPAGCLRAATIWFPTANLVRCVPSLDHTNAEAAGA